MKKVIVIGGISLLLLTAVGAGFLVLTDRLIDTGIQRLVESANAPTTVSVSKDQGSLTTRDIDITVGVDTGAETVELWVQNKVTKRPWGARIDHEIYVKEMSFAGMDFNSAQLMRDYLVNNAFVTGVSRISALGRVNTELQTVAINETVDAVTLDITPLSLRTTGTVTGALTATGVWPGFTVSVSDFEEVSMVMKPLSFELDGQMKPDTLFVGSQTVQGEGLALSIDSNSARQQFELASFSAAIAGAIENDRYDSRFDFSTDGFSLVRPGEALNVTQLRTAISLAGLNAQNYQRLINELNAMQTTGIPSQAMMDELSNVLQNGFRLELNDWQATINDQQVALSAHFELPENGVANLSNPMSLFGLIGYIDTSLDMTVDAALANDPVASDALMPLLMTGALVDEGDQYKVSFSMKDGLPLLNGSPMPLPF